MLQFIEIAYMRQWPVYNVIAQLIISIIVIHVDVLQHLIQNIGNYYDDHKKVCTG